MMEVKAKVTSKIEIYRAGKYHDSHLRTRENEFFGCREKPGAEKENYDASLLPIKRKLVYPVETSISQQKIVLFRSTQPRSHFRSVECAGKCNNFGVHLFVS